jgi:hypothetical protein
MVNKFKSYGIGGLQLSVAWNENYLQDEKAWQDLAKNVEVAKNAGFRVWIHDEKGYPSGAAGGLVVRDHPEYENRGLVRITWLGEGEKRTKFELPDSISFFRATICPYNDGVADLSLSKEIASGTEVIETFGMKGSWQLSVFGLKILDKNTQAQQTIGQFHQTGHYPSLLNKKAVQLYIDLTYQGYARHLNNIAQQVDAFYTGEPNLMGVYWKWDGTKNKFTYVPWDESLPAEFIRQHGYDLIPRLDALFAGITPEAKMIRLHYYQTISEMFNSSYAKPISEWCEKNGTKSLFQPLLEEYIAMHVINQGDMMKASRNFGIPACDIPIPKSDSTAWEFWMPKFISSAAYLEDKQAVTALLDPIVGGNGTTNLSPDVKRLRKTINMAFICGVNQISTYIPYNKYTSTDYAGFNEYIGRLAILLRGAKNAAPIAIYYPVETFQANYIASPEFWSSVVRSYSYLQKTLDKLSAGILRNGLDFNYLPADAILKGTIRKGYVEVSSHRYSVIVMPYVEVLSLDVITKLKACSAAGVKIIWTDALPSLGVSESEHAEVRNQALSFIVEKNPLKELKEIKTMDFPIGIESDDNKLTVGKYYRGNKRLYFVINDSDKEINIKATSPKKNKVKVYDPSSGEILVRTLPLNRKIGSYASLFIIE